jgi:hypothetical protein
VATGGRAPGTVIQSQMTSRMCKEGAACTAVVRNTVTANSRKGKVNHGKVERLGPELMKISGSALHKEGAPSWRFRPPINTLGKMPRQLHRMAWPQVNKECWSRLTLVAISRRLSRAGRDAG